MIQAVVTDIEGTTTSIHFVTDVLFPYARERMGDFLQQHSTEPPVRQCLDEVVNLTGIDDDLATITRQLIEWIDTDQKITPLKSLQGMIWDAGYRNGDFTGHIYPDVPAQLAAWHRDGIKLYVYSSGSVQAQKLLFGFSDAGDLSILFTDFFDTRIGNKREVAAYDNIIQHTALPADNILFLSDIEEELDAAAVAGMKTTQLCREQTVKGERHHAVSNFNEIRLNK
ncbi:MAG: acireductone synthase [Gammaproteobacteria bacterium]